MRIYNPKQWFDILFQIHKSDTLRKLFPLILIISVYTTACVWVVNEFIFLPPDIHLRQLSVFHNLIGFALSLLLVFRTNTAYDRWWEGRKLWGALVNSSRNLAIKYQALLAQDNSKNRDFFAKTIPMYAQVLKGHLQLETTRFSLDEQEHPEFGQLDNSKHLPNQIAKILHEKTISLHRQQLISGEELLYLNTELTALTDICGACERIKNTPIPYSYSAFIKKFIFIYVMTLPFGYMFTLGYWVVPVVAIVFYVMASLELIAEEIEDPFGHDANDLPMDKIAANITKHVAEIL